MTASDNTYAVNTITDLGMTNYLVATAYGFAIPSTATIKGITVEMERSATVAFHTGDQQARIVKGGVIGATDKALGSNWPAADAYATYGGGADLWGETWTPADINAASFGFAFQGKGTASPATNVAQVDHIRITITYTLPGMIFQQRRNAAVMRAANR